MTEINYQETVAGCNLAIKNSEPAPGQIDDVVQMLVSQGVKLEAIVGALKKAFPVHFQAHKG